MYIGLGVVFSGTLGLEMITKEIPVAIVGKSPYGGLGFCHKPRTEKDYKNILVGNIKRDIKPDKELIELFCYFYFIKRIIPFNLVKQLYKNENFESYNFNSLDELLPGQDYYLDHLCDSVLNNKSSEAW